MDTDGFWNLIDEHLDARRDPLDDPRVQEHLSHHPELLDGFANLTHAVATLSSTPPVDRVARPAHPGRLGRIIAGAAIVLLGLGTWWSGSTEPEVVLPDLAADGEVMRYASRCFTSGSGGHLSFEIEAGSVSILERTVLTRIQPRAATPHGHAIRTEITRQRSRVRAEFITE